MQPQGAYDPTVHAAGSDAPSHSTDPQPALNALAARHALSPDQRAALARLATHLADDPEAPTAVKDPLQVVDTHLADSLSPLELGLFAPPRSLAIADIGAGAGLPGLVLAVALPQVEVRLVESRTRKCAYIARLISDLELANAESICSRVEDWAAGREAHDVVTARALAPQPVVLEYAAPLLAIGGMLIDWRGRRDLSEEEAALAAATELGLKRDEIVKVVPFADARDRHLHLFSKVGPTPECFPRRPGMARKRPLGPSTKDR